MRLVFRLPVTDSQAGLKAFDQAGQALFLDTEISRFLVDLEFLARASRQLRVTAVEVELRPDVVFTDFGLNLLLKEVRNFAKILRGVWFGW
jgi:hypothetical protein